MKAKAYSNVRYVINGIIFFVSIFSLVVCAYMKKYFNYGLESIIFTLKSPLKGADFSAFIDGICECVPVIAFLLLIYILIIVYSVKSKVCVNISVRISKMKFSFEFFNLVRKLTGIISLVSIIFSLVYIENSYAVLSYIKSKNDTTTIYEDYYKSPESVNIIADGNEKNLIYIYLESMEITYASIEDGGKQKTNYIPNLTKHANENISFSNSEKLGGFNNVSGSGWTIGSIYSTTSGVPFSFPVENSMDKFERFAGGITVLGDILKKFGYNQTFLCGSNADFAGRRNYFEQHGNYRIIDLQAAKDKRYIPDDYFVWWG